MEGAKKEDIPIHRDEKLAESLENVKIGEYIPPELYQVVAEVLVFVDNLSESSVDLIMRFWVKKADYWEMKWKVTENAKLRLDEAGIEIPFPQLDIHQKELLLFQRIIYNKKWGEFFPSFLFSKQRLCKSIK